MKWLLFSILCFVLSAGVAFAGSDASSSATGIGISQGNQQQQGQQIQSSPSATVQQNFEATRVPAGAYRQNTEIMIPGNVTIPAFFGPFSPGWKIMDDITVFASLTMREAESLGSGAKCLLKLKSKIAWESDRVNILPQFDRKLMADPVGIIFCTAGDNTTVDVIAEAAKLAMRAGGTDIVLLKHKVSFGTAGWGAFLSGGYSHGNLSGGEKENSITAGSVGGLGYGKTSGTSEDGLVFGILRR
jgi:hypothetical protein